MSTLIELKDVCKAYDGQNVVDHVNLNIEKGEFVTLLVQAVAVKPLL